MLVIITLFYVVLLFFFFFQAEDGIRDLIVTGVQTCALPISSPRQRPTPHGWESAPVQQPELARAGSAVQSSRPAWAVRLRPPAGRRRRTRSEERRVGEEGRSRWSPYH